MKPTYVVWSSYGHLAGSSPPKVHARRIHIRRNHTHTICNREMILEDREPTKEELKTMPKCKLCLSMHKQLQYEERSRRP